MENKFSEHLIKIGFIDKKTLSQLINLHNIKKIFNQNDNQFYKKMTEILLFFFDNITDIQKKFICFHLPAKFILLNKLKEKMILKNILRKKELKHNIIMMKYLFKWYRVIYNIKNGIINIFDEQLENTKILKKQSYQSIKDDKLKKRIICNNKNNKIYNSIKEFIEKANNLNISNISNKNKSLNKEHIRNSDINYFGKKVKTQKENNINNKINFGNLNINLNRENISNYNYEENKNVNNGVRKKIYINNNQISKLIHNHSLINKKMKKLDTTKDSIESVDYNINYLSTNLNTGNRYENNKEKINLSNYLINIIKNDDKNSNFNLFNMPNNSKNSTAQKTIKLKPKNNNNIYNLIYYNNFQNLNNSNYFQGNSNFCDLNLFTEKTPFCEREIKSIESYRKPRYSHGNRLYEQGIKKIGHEKNVKNFSSGLNPNAPGKKKSVNYKYINTLYKNKTRSKTLERVKNKVEKEEGLTFRPEIYKNNYTDRINSNFLERNYSSPRNRKDKNEYNEKIRFSKTCKNKKMKKKKKEKIITGMINRLYKNKNFDEKEDNSFLCQKYIKKGIIASNYLKGYKKSCE